MIHHSTGPRHKGGMDVTLSPSPRVWLLLHSSLGNVPLVTVPYSEVSGTGE